MRLPLTTLAVVLVTGCGGDPASDSTGGGSERPDLPTPTVVATSAPPPSTVVHVPSPEKCISPYSTPARIEASLDVAFKVQSLTLCVTPDGSGTRLVNESSSLVWTIDRPSNLRWTTTRADLPLRVELFRASLGTDTAGLPLEPGQAVTLKVPPGDIHLFTEPGSQAAWESVSELVDEATSVGAGLAIDRLSRNSPERAAVLTCGFAAYQVGSGFKDAASDPALQLNAGLGFAAGATESGVECASEVRKAQQARVARAEKPVLRVEPIRVRLNSPAVVSKTNQSLKQALIRGGRLILS
jgi:hypothetical protein